MSEASCEFEVLGCGKTGCEFRVSSCGTMEQQVSSLEFRVGSSDARCGHEEEDVQ